MRNAYMAGRKEERGQTIALMAVAMISLLAMAALAIDVVTLYVARQEAQRAAEAAALAGARMFASSSFTSNLTGLTGSDVCQNSPTSSAAANKQAVAVAAENLIAGQAATIQTVTCNLSTNGNPRITVTVQRTGLPTFFARILPNQVSTVSATATAEAYNASGQSGPIQLKGVKPFLVPNCDPALISLGSLCNTPYFVDTSGAITSQGSDSIGQTFTFTRVTTTYPVMFPFGGGTPRLRFYALNVPPGSPPICPSPSEASGSCVGVGGGGGPIDSYLDNIACTSQVPFTCQQTVDPPVLLNLSVSLGIGWRTREGIRCRIHASTEGLGNGQDIITAGASQPVSIEGGDNNPNPSLQGARNISRSDSLITVPIYNPTLAGIDLCPGGLCTESTAISGFLQLAVKQSDDTPNHFDAVIVNAVGCNTGMSGTPVVGSVGSPIPVRLVQNTN